MSLQVFTASSANATELYDLNDDNAAQWEPFLSAWHKVFKEVPMKLSYVVACLSDVSDKRFAHLRDTLPDELADAFNNERQRANFSRLLGKALAAKADVQYGDLRLERAGEDRHDKVALWRVRGVRG